jgi:uncharacterized surface protein with fasciclin (FAS1) repeats
MIWGLGLVGLVVGLVACGEEGASERGPDTTRVNVTADTMTIARVLRTDDRFSTLVAAIDSAQLDSTLAGRGPYTLFAPPNAAFDALPEGTVPVLLEDRTDRLRTILAHHVVDGRVSASVLADTTTLETLSSDSLRVHTDTTLAVDNAPIVDDDIAVDNGLIHVIERVLRPPASAGE